MASSSSGSVEYLTLVDCTEQLCSGISQDPLGVSNKLLASRLVSEAQVRDSSSQSKDNYSKANDIVIVIREKVNAFPKQFEDYLNALNQLPYLRVAVSYVREKYEANRAALKPDQDSDVETSATKANMVKLEVAHTLLLCKVAKKLEEMNVDFQLLQLFIRLHFKTESSALAKASTIVDSLKVLSNVTDWKCDSITGFEELCRELGGGDKDLMMLISDYKSKLAGFKAATKIIDYLREKKKELKSTELLANPPSIQQAMAEHDVQYCHKLSVKLKSRVTEECLDYIDQLWTSLVKWLYLPPLPVLLKSICDGCIEVSWFIPTKIAWLINGAQAENKIGIVAKKLDVISMKLDMDTLYMESFKLEDFHTDLSSTLKQYHLSESDVLQPVSNDHLQKIASSHCCKWRFLPVALDMENHFIWEDIDREVPGDEEGRINEFLSCWQNEKGTDANYKSLINALLVIGCKQEAENVCELLNKTEAIIRESSGNNGELSGELIKENFSRIRGCFATLIDKVAMKLTSLNVSVDRFRTFVVILFPPGDILSNATTILEIFHAVTHTRLWDHSYFSAFESIYKEFGQGDAELKTWIDSYKADLAGFKATTKIIDYIKLCNSSDDFADSKQSISQYKARYDKKYFQKLSIKIKQKITEESLEYVDEFWRSMSDYFLLPSLPVLLECILHKGCTEITWLISTQAASHIESTLQHFQVSKITLDEKTLYTTKSNKLQNELKEKILTLTKQVNERDQYIQKLQDQIKSQTIAIERKDKTIARLLNELKEVVEELEMEKEVDSDEKSSIDCNDDQELKVDIDFSWGSGIEVPFGMTGYVQPVVVNNKLYTIGEEKTGFINYDYRIMECDISNLQDWTTLPQYKLLDFTMASLNNQLVLVGGTESHNAASQLLSVWDTDNKEWAYPYPEMPTGRWGCSAIGYNEWLAVAGGCTKLGEDDGDVLSVDILNTATKQWHAGPPIPVPWSNMKAVTVGSVCCFMGGNIEGPSNAYSVFIQDLFDTDPDISSQAEQPWKELTPLLTNYSSPLSIGSSLLALGGEDENGIASSAIHLYQPDTKEWIKVGNLPCPRCDCACIMITNRDVLVAGGNDDALARVDIAQLSF